MIFLPVPNTGAATLEAQVACILALQRCTESARFAREAAEGWGIRVQNHSMPCYACHGVSFLFRDICQNQPGAERAGKAEGYIIEA